MFAAAAAEVHPVPASRTKVIVTELLPHVGIAVSDALAMLGPVLPIVAAARPVIRSASRPIPRRIYVDIVVVPIDRPIPIVSARRPPSKSITGAECQARGEKTSCDIARGREVIGRICRIRPRAIDNGGIVIGHVNCIGICLFNGDDLFVFYLSRRDILLFV